jgi:hypothetical protein
MAQTPEEGIQSLYRNLEKNTGKSIDEWAAIARNSGIGKHKQIVEYIKSQHGLTHGYANQIALRALAASTNEAESGDPIAEQYAGAKSALKPLYDSLAAAIAAFGGDVEFSPKKAYVSVRRSKQFAIVQPASGRVDVGLVLKGESATPRLEVAGSFNAMVTHRVRISVAQEIDEELLAWLRAAYNAAG